MNDNNTPVNTGKIKIGIYYEPKKRTLTLEETCLQDALLGHRRASDFSDNLSVGQILTGVIVVYAVVCFLLYVAH